MKHKEKATPMEENKPKFVKGWHLEFLDDLRESGETNMFGATPYIRAEYPELTESEACKILTYWMRTFSERHPK